MRILTLLALAGLSCATGRAAACVPSPHESTIPCGIVLVASTGGVVDPKGDFSVVVRDLAQSPIAGSSVVIDFNGCAADVRLCSTQSAPGVTIDPSGPVGAISSVTDGSGTATFRICGGARNPTGGAPGAGAQCATIYADGVVLGTVTVAAFDQNSAGGVGPADVAAFLADEFRFPATYVGRSDFNCSGTIDPADLSVLLSASLGGGSIASCAAYSR